MGVPVRTFTQAYYHLYGHNASPFLSKTVIFSGIFCIPFPGMAKRALLLAARPLFFWELRCHYRSCAVNTISPG